MRPINPKNQAPGSPRPSDPRRKPNRGGLPPWPAGAAPQDQYDSFRASLLYCSKCRQATPTRERLLLVLPAGNLYEYLCAQCGTSTGSKTEQDRPDNRLFMP
jgi:hypothetical protein